MLALRKIVVLLLLGISSYTDIKEKNIYILPVLFAALSGISLTLTEVIIGNNYGLEIMNKYIFQPVLVSTLTYILSFFTKKGIGEGDIIIFLVIGLLIGINSEILILIMASVFSGIYCIAFLFTGKLSMERTIAFVPFILGGYICLLLRK